MQKFLTPLRTLRAYRHVLLPAGLFVLLALIPFAVWVLIQSREDLAVRDLTRQYASTLAAQLESRVAIRLRGIILLAEQRGTGALDSEAAFTQLAEFQSNQAPGLLAITWVDERFILRWAVPRAGNAVAIGADLSKLPSAPMLMKANATRKPVATPPFELLQGGKGIVMFHPVTRAGRPFGFIGAVSRIQDTVLLAFNQQLSSAFNVTVSDGALPVFSHVTGESAPRFLTQKKISIVDREWTITVSPQQAYVSSLKAPTKELVLGVGLLLSAGTAFMYAAALLGRRRAEQNQRRFQDFAESSSDWLWELDRDFRFSYVSPQIQSVLGVSAESLLGQSRRELRWSDLNPPGVMEEYKLALAAHQPFRHLEAWSLHPSGAHVKIRLTGAPTFDERGRFAGYRGTGTDITSEAHAKEALTQAQARLHNAIEALPAGFLLYDAQQRLVMWNGFVQKLYPKLAPHFRQGMPFEEVARRANDLYYGGTPDEKTARIERWIHEFNTEPTNEELYLSDGRILNAIDWRTAEGMTVCFRFDITEAKRKERDLKRAEQLLQDAIEGLPAAFLLWGPDERLVMWNSHVAEIYGDLYHHFRVGMTYLEFAGHADNLLTGPPEERDVRIAQRLVSFRSAPNTNELQTRDGRSLRLVNWRTADGATVSLRFDVTTEKRKETELRQAQKMDALGQLTGGIAHDFNNLLTVIVGNTDLLMLRYAESAQARNLVQLVRSAALRGAELTSQLLAYSRKQALSPQSLDVNRLVLRTSEMLQRVLGEHIHIETVLAGGLWPALADASQLESAVLNLALNARDAMSRGGKLTLETANFRLDEQYAAINPEVTPGQYVLLAVTDTGTGMSPETADHAFEPFFSTKEPGKGTGLGLSMVYGFVKQSGGHVKIYTEPGRGTSVKLYLPRSERPGAPADLRSAADPVPSGSETILVVEDEELVRRTVVGQLEILGYRVLEAGDGASAVAILKSDAPIDLLFTDVVLPGGMMGSELARRAGELRPSLRVLFTSGYTENAIVHQGTLDSGVVLLSKPYTKDALARKVRSMLDS